MDVLWAVRGRFLLSTDVVHDPTPPDPVFAVYVLLRPLVRSGKALRKADLRIRLYMCVDREALAGMWLT